MKPVKAIVRWIPEGEGGRPWPPRGPRYTTPATFGDERHAQDAKWSLVIEFETRAKPASSVTADVRFLVEDAPHELLVPGQRFVLYEGVRPIADGEVIGDLAGRRSVPKVARRA